MGQCCTIDYGMVWYRMEKYGTVNQDGPSNGTVWDGAVQYIMVWYGMERNSMVHLTKMDPQMELYNTSWNGMVSIVAVWCS